MAKNRKVSKMGVPKMAPRGPEKKASLSNRRIGTRNTDSHMVSIQKGQKSTPDFRACARPPKKGRIKAKLKFFFELLKKTAKKHHFSPFLAIFSHFCLFSVIFTFFWDFSASRLKTPFFNYILNEQEQ